jgi:predicted DNA repair protein MutK
MESLMFNGLVQWAVYGVSALACYWAWDKMFFWLVQKDLKAIVRILGAVLLFTPAPLDPIQAEAGLFNGEVSNYAPAFLVILFRALLEKNASYLDAVICMLVGLIIGLILMSLLSLFNFFRAKFKPQD